MRVEAIRRARPGSLYAARGVSTDGYGKRQVQGEARPPSAQTADEAADFATLTVPKLRKLLKGRGIQDLNTLRKNQLVELAQAAA